MTSAHRRPLVQKTAWSTAANACTALGNVLASVLVARTLGPDGAGLTAYLTWAAATGVLIVTIGMPAALQRYVAEFHGANDDAGALQLARGLVRRIVGIALAVTIAGAVGVLLFQDGSRVALALLVLFAAHAGAEAYRSWLLGAQRFCVATQVAVATVVLQLVGVTLGSMHFGVPGAVLGYALGLLVPAVGAVRIALLPTEIRTTTDELRVRLRRYSRETYLALVVSLVAWSQLEVVFLRPTWGDHGVAMFTTGLIVARLAAHGPTLLAGGLLPHLTERATAGDVEAVRRTYGSATRILGALAMPLCFGAAAISPHLIPVLYGDAFREAIPAAVVLCTTSAIGATAAAGSALLYAMERSRFVLLSGIVGAALAVAGFALVIPAAGALGAAATRGAVQLGMVAIGTWYIARRLQVPVPLGSLGRSAVAAALCAAAATACIHTLTAPLSIGVAIVAGAAVYALAARALRTMESDDTRALSDAVALLPSILRGPCGAAIRFVTGTPR